MLPYNCRLCVRVRARVCVCVWYLSNVTGFSCTPYRNVTNVKLWTPVVQHTSLHLSIPLSAWHCFHFTLIFTAPHLIKPMHQQVSQSTQWLTDNLSLCIQRFTHQFIRANMEGHLRIFIHLSWKKLHQNNWRKSDWWISNARKKAAELHIQQPCSWSIKLCQLNWHARSKIILVQSVLCWNELINTNKFFQRMSTVFFVFQIVVVRRATLV